MKIFGFFNSVFEQGLAQGVAIGEDGNIAVVVYAACESIASDALGMVPESTWSHGIYDKLYPEGWEAEFVYLKDDRDNHIGLQTALAAFHKKHCCVQEH